MSEKTGKLLISMDTLEVISQAMFMALEVLRLPLIVRVVAIVCL